MVNDVRLVSYNPVFCGSRRSENQSRGSGFRFPASPIFLLFYYFIIIFNLIFYFSVSEKT